MTRDVFIIDGARTPFLKAGARPNALWAADLAVTVAKPLLARQPFAPSDIGEVIIGCVGPSAAEVNIGRIIALRSGCGHNVPGWTVQRNCASGLQAIDNATTDIINGRHDLVLAGGTEAMSKAAFLFSEDFINWMANFKATKDLGSKLKMLLKLKPHYFIPVLSLLKALNDPVVNLSMGQTAEKLAYIYGISRTQMDEFSVQSHKRAQNAIEKKFFSAEIIPLFDWLGNFYENDNGIRADSTVEILAKLKPSFDKPFGLVTAGNSSQVSDGAALVILASQDAVNKYSLKPIARIIDFSWSALDPSIMGLGPALAIAKLLSKNNLKMDDIDYWEINEAFSCQVLACIKHLQQENIGNLPIDRLNVDGGAVAIGHPVGASGARLTLHLARVLQRNGARYGLASLCIGGGQGGAILIENMRGDK